MATPHQIVSFPGTEKITAAEAGSKGFSLIRMVMAGLSVPPGIVLTTRFFEPWFEEISGSAAWMALGDTSPGGLATLTAELKALCSALQLNDEQREQLRERLEIFGENVLYAVRSSSPEEDLQLASFAGVYETRLGVPWNGLGDAIRCCFASGFDERMFRYKKERGLGIPFPRFAVIVRKQINSEIAGVAFSLNPLTNDYDEAVINANWELGESVAAGLASPDHFVLEKVDCKVLERKLGEKQVSIRLVPGGGTFEQKGDVLIAYTTDPGWTPLFVNAAAVVIEVGGMLQHGAVIAREYRKPCVAGIDGLMTKLHDGQLVEVNGTTGIVRLIP